MYIKISVLSTEKDVRVNIDRDDEKEPIWVHFGDLSIAINPIMAKSLATQLEQAIMELDYGRDEVEE